MRRATSGTWGSTGLSPLTSHWRLFATWNGLFHITGVVGSHLVPPLPLPLPLPKAERSCRGSLLRDFNEGLLWIVIPAQILQCALSSDASGCAGPVHIALV